MLRLDLRVSRMGFLVFLLGGIGEGCKNSLFWPILAFFGCFQGMMGQKILEIQVCGRHNLEPYLSPSFHTSIFDHEDMAQLSMPKNAVFYSYLIFKLDLILSAATKCLI